MKVSEVKQLLDAAVDVGLSHMDFEVKTACGSDLMSDVLAFVKEQGILLTGLVNPQVLRTAEMMDIRVICFVRGKQPNADMVAMAQQKDMVLLHTQKPMFVACGILYSAGLVPGEDAGRVPVTCAADGGAAEHE